MWRAPAGCFKRARARRQQQQRNRRLWNAASGRSAISDASRVRQRNTRRRSDRTGRCRLDVRRQERPWRRGSASVLPRPFRVALLCSSHCWALVFRHFSQFHCRWPFQWCHLGRTLAVQPRPVYHATSLTDCSWRWMLPLAWLVQHDRITPPLRDLCIVWPCLSSNVQTEQPRPTCHGRRRPLHCRSCLSRSRPGASMILSNLRSAVPPASVFAECFPRDMWFFTSLIYFHRRFPAFEGFDIVWYRISTSKQRACNVRMTCGMTGRRSAHPTSCAVDWKTA